MVCPVYSELSNGLKMSLVGVALGAIAWFIVGTGAKESYAKRKHEREVEQRQAERDREKREHEREMAELKRRAASSASIIGSSMFKGWQR